MDQSVRKFSVECPQDRMRLLLFGVTTGVIDTQIVTCAATAGATQADFFLAKNVAGQTAAVWLDIDAAGTAPTADEYTDADFQIEVDIATGDTAADVGAAVVAAMSTTLPDVTITDNLDGTITFVQTLYGAVAAFGDFNAAGSAGGSFAVNQSVVGLLPALGNGKFDGSVTQTAGTFVVTFNEAFIREPEVGVTCITDNRTARITVSALTAVTIETQNISGGAAADGSFSMLVCGSDAGAIAQG